MRWRPCIALFGMLLGGAALAAPAEEFQLRDHCPPSFEKTAAGRCELRSLYQFYDSLGGKGVGGTKTGLPPQRDGFTPQQIDLGRYLFFDPLLSGDGTHVLRELPPPRIKGLSRRSRRVRRGRRRGRGPRRAHAVERRLPEDGFFWDARATLAGGAGDRPAVFGQGNGQHARALRRTLGDNATYRGCSARLFPTGAKRSTLEHIYTALAAFQTSLMSLNSRYDRYAQGHHEALSAREIEGMNVFRSFVARCAECHTPPLFTNQQVAVLGTPEPEGRPLDVGAEKTFDAPKLKGAFKVPTLRNVAQTAPYMHSGRFCHACARRWLSTPEGAATRSRPAWRCSRTGISGIQN
jgi:cytochrome c peroxidase